MGAVPITANCQCFNVIFSNLTAQEIIANKDNIFRCAKAFRRDANALMLQLAQKFEFDLHDCGAWPKPVYNTSRNKKGMLNEEWSFFLHGAHCCFEHIVTGQTLEVRYTEKPEFGILDGFFFYTYMQTTDEFKNLAKWFNNQSNVYVAVDILLGEGILTKISGQISGHFSIAL